MADRNRLRRERLFALLPKIYAAQPRGSAVGELIETFASALTALDDHTRAMLNARWLVSAPGEWEEWEDWIAAALDGPHPTAAPRPTLPPPLELLGLLLGLPRAAWEIPDPPGPDKTAWRRAARQRVEAYRRRLFLSSRLFTSGAATPRSILQVAALSLGQELCPIVQRQGGDPATSCTSTLGRALDIGTPRSCAVCRGSGRAPAGRACGLPQARALRLSVTDWPVERVQRTFTTQLRPADADGGAFTFRLDWPGVLPDRPELQVEVLDGALAGFSLRSLNTEEETVYFGRLAAGTGLRVGSTGDPRFAAFDGPEGIPHHSYLALNPSGVAIRSVGPLDRDDSSLVAFVEGKDARYKEGQGPFTPPKGRAPDPEPHFAAPQALIRLPLAQPGPNSWVFTPSPVAHLPGIAADTGAPALIAAATALSSIALDPLSTVKVRITLRGVSRSPATFRLRIQKDAALNALLAAHIPGGAHSGELPAAHTLLLEQIERARPAGVRALIELLEPVLHEDADLGEGGLRIHLAAQWQLDQGPEEVLSIGLTAALTEDASADELAAFEGRFDETNFDFSRYATGDVGFHLPADAADLAEGGIATTGVFGEALLDHTLFDGGEGPTPEHHALSEGAPTFGGTFEATPFDHATFNP